MPKTLYLAHSFKIKTKRERILRINAEILEKVPKIWPRYLKICEYALKK
jgi:hypothetical protein